MQRLGFEVGRAEITARPVDASTSMGQPKKSTRRPARVEGNAPRAATESDVRLTSNPARNATRNPSSSVVTWTCAALVLAVTWLVFRPALDGQWLRWDDDQLLLDRTEWRGLGAAQLHWMFTTFHMGPYQPLSWISYAIDHERHGLDPRGYHATNVLLHAASAVVLFFVARLVFTLATATRDAKGREGAHAAGRSSSVDARVEIAAAISALAWAIHPLRVESVAWITERRDCLSGLFGLLATWAWLTHVTTAGASRRWFRLALAAFAASLLSKGLALMLPFAWLALEIWPLRRFEAGAEGGAWRRWRERVVEAWPFWILSAAAGVSAVVGQRVTGAMVAAETHGLAARVTQSFYGLAFYVRKTLWPDDLMVLYPMSVPLDATEPRFVLSIVGVLVVAVLVWVARRRIPAIAVAAMAYVLLVAPVLGLVQVGSQLVADRYSHVSTIPWILLAGGGLLHLSRRFGAGASRGAVAVGIVGVALLLPLARATNAQIAVWRDTESLWTHDLSIDPKDQPARRSLLAEYQVRIRETQDPARRRELFERAFEVDRAGDALAPDAACASHVAKLHDMLAAEDPERRAEHLQQALRYAQLAVERVATTTQRLPDAYEALGVVLSELGRPDEALPHLRKVVELDPRSARRRGMLAEVLMQAGRPAEALEPLRVARELDPDSNTILLDLGDAHRQLGDTARAAAAYRLVIEAQRKKFGVRAAADPEHAAAAQALVEMGQTP